MGLESTAVYISQLNSSWPLGTDKRSTSDDHHRLVKAVLIGQFPNFSASAVLSTVTEINLLSGYSGVIPELGTVQEWTKSQNFNAVSLTDAVSITWDLSIAQVCEVTLTANRTLASPTNHREGGVFIIKVNQDAGGGNTLAFNSNYKFPGSVQPIVAAGSADISILTFVSFGGFMYGSYSLDMG